MLGSANAVINRPEYWVVEDEDWEVEEETDEDTGDEVETELDDELDEDTDVTIDEVLLPLCDRIKTPPAIATIITMIATTAIIVETALLLIWEIFII